MDEYIESIKKVKRLVGEYLKECADDKKVDAGNITYVKEALSAFQKACWIIEDHEGESGGEYGAQRRSRRTGRYMMGGGYGWMPGPYYDGGMDRYGLADDLDEMAKHANSEAERTSYLEAAHKLRNG